MALYRKKYVRRILKRIVSKGFVGMNAQSVCILGRQPALGMAELESLYGASSMQPLAGAALLDINPNDIAFNRIGGTMKLAKLLTRLDTTEWAEILKYLTTTLPHHLQSVPEGKIRFGLSLYGLAVKPATINRGGLEIKKVIKHGGRSVRIVPNTAAELNSAQVIHNQLTGPTGMELLLIRQGKRTLLAQTIKVQDISAYAARDQARPKRDPRIGMLPPKLAQIIINLAGTHTLSTTGLPPTGEESKKSTLVHPGPARLLDPFCGTGVMLQEALLMGYDAYGTDLEPRMIAYSEANLAWLTQRHKVTGSYELLSGDATEFQWQQPVDLIASETYLGRPFSAEPTPEALNEVIRGVDTIHKKFLRNVAWQTQPGFRMCLAVPAWKTGSGFRYLPVLDQLTDMGYNRLSFVHVRNEDLIYHRANQIVTRELAVLEKK